MKFFAVLLLLASGLRAEPVFVDVADEAGIERRNTSGGLHKRWILESTGSGAAFFDCDADGDLDLYLVDGSTYEHYGQGAGNVLYRNEGGGAFSEVAVGAEDRGWGIGAAVGDVDGDGHDDLYVTNYGANALYRNKGDGTFAAIAAGTAGDDYSASAAFFDYDRDGDLDLYVANYVEFDIAPVLADPVLDDPCIYLGGLRVFCGPQGMEGGRDRLYRNDGNGTFADITSSSGIATANFNYGLGVVPEDFDGDGDLDLFVANDETANALFRNDSNIVGVFVDVAVEAGVAFNGDGEPEAGMGVDAGDPDGDGDIDLFVSNFYGETNTFYENAGDGTFADRTAERGLAAPSVGYLGWGVRFFDYDLDGALDLFVANGHVYPQVDEASAGGRYVQRNQLFANRGVSELGAARGDVVSAAFGRYEEVDGGPGLAVEKSSRGIASGDYDNDGDVDLLVTNIDARPTLLRNDAAPGAWLAVQLEGTKLGARVSVATEERVQTARVNGAAGYLGHNDTRLYFGLGDLGFVERLDVQWPDGARDRIDYPPVNKLLIVRRGQNYEVEDLMGP